MILIKYFQAGKTEQSQWI